VNDAAPAGDSITRNALFAVGVKLTGMVFTAVLVVFLTRYLGPAEYGVFALAMGVGGLVLMPSRPWSPTACASSSS
jgi:O-antigen/teichoic acid export membrane protein